MDGVDGRFARRPLHERPLECPAPPGDCLVTHAAGQDDGRDLEGGIEYPSLGEHLGQQVGARSAERDLTGPEGWAVVIVAESFGSSFSRIVRSSVSAPRPEPAASRFPSTENVPSDSRVTEHDDRSGMRVRHGCRSTKAIVPVPVTAPVSWTLRSARK